MYKLIKRNAGKIIEFLHRYEKDFLYGSMLCIFVSNYMKAVILNAILLIIFFVYVASEIIGAYFKDSWHGYKRIIYLFFMLVAVHVCLGMLLRGARDEKPVTKETVKSEVVYKTFISDEDRIVFFEKPFFNSGIRVISSPVGEGKVLDCSIGDGKNQFQASKKYENAENSDFSLSVMYYAKNIEGNTKFTIIFQLADKKEKDLGFLTYVLYGDTDHYCNVNTIVEGVLYGTFIVNPEREQWKTFEVNSIINDYNTIAVKLGGKAWDDLQVKKINVTIVSWSADKKPMIVYLKKLKINRQKRL